MFEKEAEEYVRKIWHDVINWGGTEPEERFYNEIKFKQAYLAGVEFGYNKANEWHYVKDGEYPKECDCCLLYLGSRFNCITGWRHRGVWYFDDNRNLKMRQDEVIAWKEIVLPKEIKEND